MKNFIVTCITFFALLLASGCSEKFNIAAPYKNITVVYGFLDVNDTAHYIRIQKAFLDQTKSALTMATDPDSNFYASLNVKIERFTFTDNVHPVDTIHLNRVDLNLEGYPKQPGQFFTAPNYAYKFKANLDPNYLYRLLITNPAANVADSADAPIIDDSNSGAFYVDELDTTRPQYMDFSSLTNDPYYEITGYYTPSNSSFSFEGLANPAVIGQTIIRFNWTDSNSVTHQLVPHYNDFNAGFFNLSSNGGIDVKIFNATLYGAVASALDPAPANTYRLLGRCNISVYLSTLDFNNYEQSSLTQGTGLTGTEIEPIYSNIKGTDALGLFTSRAMRSASITLTLATVDSLEASPILQTANIAGTK